MSNVVEFILRLKDMMSGGMQKVASSARSNLGAAEKSAARVNNELAKTAKHANAFGTSINRQANNGTRSIATLERAIRRLEFRKRISLDLSEIRRANRDIDTLQRRVDRLNGGSRNKGASSGLLGLLGSRGAIAASVGIGLLAAGAGTSLSMGMNAGAQRTSFETMAGKREGGALFGDLTKFANDSIFGNELYQNAQTMLAFGSAAKDVMPDLKMLGDVSMGNKEKLGSLSLAYSQIQATGRLMGQDLLQLINAGFNPLQIISDKTGVSMGDLKERMEEGRIGADMVKRAFQDATGPGGRFYQMTQKIADTPFGKWEAMKGQVSGIAVELGTELLPIASSFMDAFEPILNDLPIIIKQTVPHVQQLSNNLLPVLTTTASVFGKVLPPAIKLVASLANVSIKALKPLLTLLDLVAGALGNVIDTIASLLGSSHVPDAANGMMNNVAVAITEGKSDVAAAMSGVISSGEMDSLFEAAGKRHGEIYSNFLREGVESVKATLSKDDALASWKSSNGKYISSGGGKGAMDDVLSRSPSKGEYLDMIPAHLRAVGLNQGRAAFDTQVSEAKKIAAMQFKGDKTLVGAIDKIAQEQRNYLMGLANGSVNSKANGGYVFSASKKDKKGASGLSADGITHSGPRQITINVNKEMIGELSINSHNIREGVGEMEEYIREAILRVFKSLESE